MKRKSFSSRVLLVFPLGIALLGSAAGCSDGGSGSGSGTAGLCTTFCNRMDECGNLGSSTIADCQSNCNGAAPQCSPTPSAYQACDSALKAQDCSTLQSSLPPACAESTLCQGAMNGGNGGGGNGGNGGSSNGGNGGNGGTSNGGGACDTVCGKYVECGFVQASDQAACVSGCQGATLPDGCDFNACASALAATSCDSLTSGGYPAACAACDSSG